MRRQMLHRVVFGLTGLLAVGLVFFWPHHANAASPSTVNFQGKVVNADGTNVADGTYSFIFRLYNTASPTTTGSCTLANNCLWEETDTISTVNGIFQVELGSNCSFFSAAACNNNTAVDFSSDSLYLTMKFNGDSAGFMTPSIHFTGVPYAYYAGNSASLGGLAAGNFVQLAQGLQTDASSANASIAVNKTAGTANIVQLQRGGSNVFVIDNGGAATFTSQTNSATAFQIQNSSAISLMTADTTGSGGITFSSGTSAFSDEFNTGGPTAGVQWTPFTATGTSYQVNPSSSGVLRFTADTANHDCWPTNGMNCAYLAEAPPTGNFQMEEKILVTPTNVQAPGMMAYQDSNNFMRFEYENVSATNKIRLNMVINGVGTPDAVSCTTGTQPMWLRVNRSGNLWTVSYSTDGTAYTVCGSFSAALNLAAGTAFIGPSYNGGTGAAAFSGDIDYFRVTTDQAVLKSTGYTLFKPATDSVTALQIQDSSTNSTLFNADTTNFRIGIGTSTPNYTLDVSGGIGASSLVLASTSAYSNEFNSSTNTGWSLVNPLADASSATTTTNSGELTITPSPTTTTRDCFTGGSPSCLRFVENAPTSDFQADTKIDSTPGSSQALGILVYQDANNFVRFEFQGPSGATSINAQAVLSSSPTTPLTCSPVVSAPLYLRVKRISNTWTMYYSANGTSFTQCGTSFSAALNLSSGKLGLHIDNAGTNAFSPANFDYFRVVTGSATTLSVSGDSLIQSSLNSATAFQVKNASGTNALAVDTTNNTVTVSNLSVNGTCTGCGSLASSYNSAAVTGNTITLSQNGGGVIIQDASTPLSPASTNLFSVQKNTGSVNYFGVSSIGLSVQSNFTGSAVNALTFDTSAATPHLKIFGSSGTNYMDIYYDEGTSSAIIAAPTGTTKVGSGTGPVTINSGAAAAVNITGHANSTWQTDAGALTIQSASAATWSTAAGTLSIQGGGGLSLSSATTNALTIDTTTTGSISIGTNANAKTITIGNNSGATALILASGTGNVTVKTSGVFQIQNTSSANFLSVNTSGNIQVGSASTDATAILLVLDSYNGASDPAGTNGALYYNTSKNKLRCYENGVWTDCISAWRWISKPSDQAATQSNTTLQNDNDLVVPLAANSVYQIQAFIPVDDSNATADLKYSFTVPSGATITLFANTYSTATALVSCNIIASAQACSTTVNSANNQIVVNGFVRTSATSGNLQFQFSQNTTAAASFPVIKGGATIGYIKSQ